MIEKHIVLEDIDPVVFYGINNVHLQMVKSLFPKLRIVARGNVIKVLGDDDETERFEENIRGALAQDTIYLKGGEQTVMPRFFASSATSAAHRREPSPPMQKRTFMFILTSVSTITSEGCWPRLEPRIVPPIS